MKKIAPFILGLALSTYVYALPIGNPWEASLTTDGIIWKGHHASFSDPCARWCDAWSIRLGFYGNYVYNYHMEVDQYDNHASIHDTEIWTNAGSLTFNLFDWVDIFAILGATHCEINTPRKAFGGSGNNDYLTIETETDVSWSIGIRSTIWECGPLGIGGEAQYFYTRPDLNYIKRENSDPVYFHNGDNLKLQEWQIGFGAAYRINIASCTTALIPYLGVKWGRARINMSNLQSNLLTNLTFYNLRSEHEFGYAVGLTLLGCNKTAVTVEAHFIDQKALYVNGQFRF